MVKLPTARCSRSADRCGSSAVSGNGGSGEGAGRWGYRLAVGGDGAPGPSGEGAVVEQEEFGGEGIRVRGARVRGQGMQSVIEQLGVGSEPLVRGVLWVGDLHGGGEEGAPPRRLLPPVELVEGVEHG